MLIYVMAYLKYQGLSKISYVKLNIKKSNLYKSPAKCPIPKASLKSLYQMSHILSVEQLW